MIILKSGKENKIKFLGNIIFIKKFCILIQILVILISRVKNKVLNSHLLASGSRSWSKRRSFEKTFTTIGMGFSKAWWTKRSSIGQNRDA